MGYARGILLDVSLLDGHGDDGVPCLAPGAEDLLRRLRFSDLRVGICYQDSLSPQKEFFFERTAAAYFFEFISLTGAFSSNSFVKQSLGLAAHEDTYFFATSKENELLFCALQDQGWRIIYNGISDKSTNNKDFFYINKLPELLSFLCSFNKMALHGEKVLKVGYVMNRSREEYFLKRGALPICPSPNGLIFVPLIFDLPLAPQVEAVDLVLHKATDEIITIDPGFNFSFPEGILFSPGMHELGRYVQNRPNFCIIDPLDRIYPLLDRHKIQQILVGLADLNVKDKPQIRAPQYLKVDSFEVYKIKEQLSAAKLSFPAIVKPQVACGVSDSHDMALVFKFEDFKNLNVPLPAVIQEYVDHDSLLFKFYVLGDKVFHAVKKSMPNADVLFSLSMNAGSAAPLTFNSLKSLPSAKDGVSSLREISNLGKHSLDLEMANAAACWLRRNLDLTIFGFDLVVQEGSGDHVIVDLNYLPSFKEIPDSEAIPAFWEAIRSSYNSWKNKHLPREDHVES